MSAALDRLTTEKKRINRAIERELARLRRGCKHKVWVRARARTNTGYLWRCKRCHIEHHAWTPPMSRTDFEEVTYTEFMDARVPGFLVRLGVDDAE